MYQVYKNKETGKPVLAVRVRETGKITKGSKQTTKFYSEYPSQVEVTAKELTVGDYIVQTDKGNELVSAGEFEQAYQPQASMIG